MCRSDQLQLIDHEVGLVGLHVDRFETSASLFLFKDLIFRLSGDLC